MTEPNEKPAAPISDANAESRPAAKKKRPIGNALMQMRTGKVLLLVLAAAALLTAYLYLEQNYFAPRRPVVWTDFDPAKINEAVRQRQVVVALVGEFYTDAEIRTLTASMDTPEVRRHAHRLASMFTVIKLESKSNAPIMRTWIAPRIGLKHYELPEKPFVVVLYEKLESPIVIQTDGNLSAAIAKTLKEIRVGKRDEQKEESK